MEVEHPLQTGSKVPGGAVGFFFRVDIDPFDPFTQVECPSQAAVLAAPVLGNTGNRNTVGVNLQQAVPVVTQDIEFLLALGIEHIEGFHLVDNGLGHVQIGDRFMLGRFRSCFRSALPFRCRYLGSLAAFGRSRFGCFPACVAGSQRKCCSQSQCKQFGHLFFHAIALLVIGLDNGGRPSFTASARSSLLSFRERFINIIVKR